VQVDEARDDELAGGVDPLHRPVGRDGRQDRGHLPILDSEIPLASEALARIQHLAVGDDQIELEPGIGGVEAHRQRLPRLSEEDRRRLRAAGLGHRRRRHRRARPEPDEIAPRHVHRHPLVTGPTPRGSDPGTTQAADKGPSAEVRRPRPHAHAGRAGAGGEWRSRRARASHREYASRAAFGRRLASGLFSAAWVVAGAPSLAETGSTRIIREDAIR
jgi:hypothetical protein